MMTVTRPTRTKEFASSNRVCSRLLSLTTLAATLALAFPSLGKADLPQVSPSLFFADANVEKSHRALVHEQVLSLIPRLAKVSDERLLEELENAEKILISVQRHAAYARLQVLQNVDDTSMAAAQSQMGGDVSAIRSAVDNRLSQIKPEQVPLLGRFAKQAEELLQNAKENQAHRFSPDIALYRSKVVLAFQKDVARNYAAQIEKIEQASKASGAPTNAAAPNPEDLIRRRAQLSQTTQAYAKQAASVASLLASQIDVFNRDALAQAYANAAERKYSSIGMDTASVTASLQAFVDAAPAYRRYQNLLREHSKQVLHLDKVDPADLALSFRRAKPLNFDEARQMIIEALSPIGPDYRSRFTQLLDPANGRLSLSGGIHRSAAAGTSVAVYDAPLAVYMGKFDGSLKSVSTLAHEGGHAIHRELMNESGLITYLRNGPPYLFEAHGILNDLLLLNYAAEHAVTKEQKIAALEALLEKISLEIFGSAQETMFEHSMYESASKRGLLSPQEIDHLYREAIAPYDIWQRSDDEIAQAWMQKSHVFDDPLYYVNYLYSGLCAFTLFSKITEEPAFADSYFTLLKRGFDAPPERLLASLDIDLKNRKLLEKALHIFTKKTDELEKLYRELGELQ